MIIRIGDGTYNRVKGSCMCYWRVEKKLSEEAPAVANVSAPNINRIILAPGKFDEMVEIAGVQKFFFGTILADSRKAGLLDSFNTLMINIRRERSNVILWYGVWVSNKDYSSLMNASFAIGKLSSLVDLAIFQYSDFNQEQLSFLEEISKECREQMEYIAKNCGRITPYSSGGTISM